MSPHFFVCRRVPLPGSCLGPPSPSYRAICKWLLPALGLEVPWSGQAANLAWLLLVLGLGPLSKRYGACWGQMLLDWEILEKSKTWSKRDHLYGKATGNDWVDPHVRWSRVLGNHQGGVPSVSQIDGDSDMTPATWLCSAWGGLRERSGLCQHFCLVESAPLPSRLSHSDARQFSFSLFVPGSFQDAAPVLELKGGESE